MDTKSANKGFLHNIINMYHHHGNRLFRYCMLASKMTQLRLDPTRTEQTKSDQTKPDHNRQDTVLRKLPCHEIT